MNKSEGKAHYVRSIKIAHFPSSTHHEHARTSRRHRTMTCAYPLPLFLTPPLPVRLQKFKTLFSPTKLGELSLKNRFAVAPMTRARGGKELLANDFVKQYYEAVSFFATRMISARIYSSFFFRSSHRPVSSSPRACTSVHRREDGSKFQGYGPRSRLRLGKCALYVAVSVFSI
jgi:hypothetical protein